MFRSLGFEECPDGTLEADIEKIAIYGNDDEFEHVAFQRNDGSWSSKLGELGDIRHDGSTPSRDRASSSTPTSSRICGDRGSRILWPNRD